MVTPYCSSQFTARYSNTRTKLSYGSRDQCTIDNYHQVLVIYFTAIYNKQPIQSMAREALVCRNNLVNGITTECRKLATLRRSRLRRTPSVPSRTSQPFSACNCRRENTFSRSISRQFFFLFSSFFPLFSFSFVLCLNLLLLRPPGRHKPSSDSHIIHVPQAQQNSLQSALHRAAKYIQQYVRFDQSATTQASKQTRVSQMSAESPHVRVF